MLMIEQELSEEVATLVKEGGFFTPAQATEAAEWAAKQIGLSLEEAVEASRTKSLPFTQEGELCDDQISLYLGLNRLAA